MRIYIFLMMLFVFSERVVLGMAKEELFTLVNSSTSFSEICNAIKNKKFSVTEEINNQFIKRHRIDEWLVQLLQGSPKNSDLKKSYSFLICNTLKDNYIRLSYVQSGVKQIYFISTFIPYLITQSGNFVIAKDTNNSSCWFIDTTKDVEKIKVMKGELLSDKIACCFGPKDVLYSIDDGDDGAIYKSTTSQPKDFISMLFINEKLTGITYNAKKNCLFVFNKQYIYTIKIQDDGEFGDCVCEVDLGESLDEIVDSIVVNNAGTKICIVMRVKVKVKVKDKDVAESYRKYASLYDSITKKNVYLLGEDDTKKIRPSWTDDDALLITHYETEGSLKSFLHFFNPVSGNFWTKEVDRYVNLSANNLIFSKGHMDSYQFFYLFNNEIAQSICCLYPSDTDQLSPDVSQFFTLIFLYKIMQSNNTTITFPDCAKKIYDGLFKGIKDVIAEQYTINFDPPIIEEPPQDTSQETTDQLDNEPTTGNDVVGNAPPESAGKNEEENTGKKTNNLDNASVTGNNVQSTATKQNVEKRVTWFDKVLSAFVKKNGQIGDNTNVLGFADKIIHYFSENPRAQSMFVGAAILTLVAGYVMFYCVIKKMA